MREDLNFNSKFSISTGFVYTDLVVDDARLVILNILYANQNGAVTHKNTECISAKFNHNINLWEVELRNVKNNTTFTITARCIVNSSSQMVNQVLSDVLNYHSNYNIRLVKGSHIVVPKLLAGNNNYVLQNYDGRIIFIINSSVFKV